MKRGKGFAHTTSKTACRRSRMHFPAKNLCWRWAQSTCDNNNYRRPFPRHQQMANFAFADGHSKAMRVDRIIKKADGSPMTWGDPNCMFDDK